MLARKNKELFEAIFFFGKTSIVKEMRYSEFEAVLDGVVGILELANKEVNAAYLKIDSTLRIHSVVTFQIAFNAQGFADEDWNIPLKHLAENAGPGPDLGAGPIRLACRSQCSVSWYQRELWEPNQREVNHFQLLIDSVIRNKLGLIADDRGVLDSEIPVVSQSVEDDVPLMSEPVELPVLDNIAQAQVSTDVINQKLAEQAVEFQQKVDALINRQKQTLQTLEEKYKDEIDQVKRAMRNEAQTYRHRAQDLEQQANQNKVLLEKLQNRNTKLEREQIRFQEQAESQQDQYDQLRKEYLELLSDRRALEDEKQNSVVQLKEELTAKTFEIDELKEALSQAKALSTEFQEKVSSYQQHADEVSDTSSTEIEQLNKRLESKRDEAAESKARIALLEDERSRLDKQLTELKAQFGSTSTALVKYESANAQLKGHNKSLELNVHELSKKLEERQAEVERLKTELSEAESAADISEIFDRMEDLELVFVAYHPGAGHITLPARQLEDYLEKPLGVAAQKCGVTLEHYKAWLAHYDASECGQCSVPVKRVDSPSDFQPGVSDRCSKHRLVGDNVAMFRKTS
jgi:hypothetical protein